MKCSEVADLLLHGDIESDELTGHLARCDDCNRLRNSLNRMVEAGIEVQGLNLSEQCQRETRKRVAQIVAAQRSAPATRLHRGVFALHPALLKLAAAVVIVLTCTLLYMQRPVPDAVEGVVRSTRDDLRPIGDLELEISALRAGICRDIAYFKVRHSFDGYEYEIARRLETLKRQIVVCSVQVEKEFAVGELLQ